VQSSGRHNIIEIITAITLVCGTLTGIWAAAEYHVQNQNIRTNNSLVMDNQLLNMERETYKTLEQKPFLKIFFVRCPDNVNPVQFAHTRVDMLYPKNEKLQKHIQWRTVPELSNNLFSYDSFRDKSNEHLRDANYLAESYLYLLSNAYAAKEGEVIDDADWETWCGYFYDIGAHPIFLSAIYFGHKYGYFDNKFAKEIQKRLCENPANKALLEEIYPELLQLNWSEKIGKNRSC
jgi:hypothetical protein